MFKIPAQPYSIDRRFCIAPMMDLSDRHCRYLWRVITRHAVLYTEMVTTGAVLKGDRDYLLKFDPTEHPLALQLGGSDPQALAQCAQIAQEWGYDEINFNCGCPSDRVQTGKIGAILMAEPNLVADCMAAMRESCSLPVTIKHRIGIDDMDDYEDMVKFVDIVAGSGCDTFIIHARKAWLKGLSPKQNRDIPPLKYELIFQLKKAFPHLQIIINGGIKSLSQAKFLLQHVDGVMIGREAYQNPYFLADVDQILFASTAPIKSRKEITHAFIDYVKHELSEGTSLHHMTRHLLGLYAAQPGARQFRRYLTENASQPGATAEVIQKALSYPQA